VAVAVAVVSYINYAAHKVSQRINEANVLVDEGEAKMKELGSEDYQFFSGIVPQSFFVEGAKHKTTQEDAFVNKTASKKEAVLDRAKLEKSIAKTDEILNKVVESYRAAAVKFDEGRKVALGSVVPKYLELKSQAYQKRADAEEAHRKAAVLLLDKSIPSESERRKKVNVLFLEACNSHSEFIRLDDEAERLHDDNKSKFK